MHPPPDDDQHPQLKLNPVMRPQGIGQGASMEGVEMGLAPPGPRMEVEGIIPTAVMMDIVMRGPLEPPDSAPGPQNEDTNMDQDGSQSLDPIHVALNLIQCSASGLMVISPPLLPSDPPPSSSVEAMEQTKISQGIPMGEMEQPPALRGLGLTIHPIYCILVCEACRHVHGGDREEIVLCLVQEVLHSPRQLSAIDDLYDMLYLEDEERKHFLDSLMATQSNQKYLSTILMLSDQQVIPQYLEDWEWVDHIQGCKVKLLNLLIAIPEPGQFGGGLRELISKSFEQSLALLSEMSFLIRRHLNTDEGMGISHHPFKFLEQESTLDRYQSLACHLLSYAMHYVEDETKWGLEVLFTEGQKRSTLKCQDMLESTAEENDISLCIHQLFWNLLFTVHPLSLQHSQKCPISTFILLLNVDQWGQFATCESICSRVSSLLLLFHVVMLNEINIWLENVQDPEEGFKAPAILLLAWFLLQSIYFPMHTVKGRMDSNQGNRVHEEGNNGQNVRSSVFMLSNGLMWMAREIYPKISPYWLLIPIAVVSDEGGIHKNLDSMSQSLKKEMLKHLDCKLNVSKWRHAQCGISHLLNLGVMNPEGEDQTEFSDAQSRKQASTTLSIYSIEVGQVGTLCQVPSLKDILDHKYIPTSIGSNAETGLAKTPSTLGSLHPPLPNDLTSPPVPDDVWTPECLPPQGAMKPVTSDATSTNDKADMEMLRLYELISYGKSALMAMQPPPNLAETIKEGDLHLLQEVLPDLQANFRVLQQYHMFCLIMERHFNLFWITPTGIGKMLPFVLAMHSWPQNVIGVIFVPFTALRHDMVQRMRAASLSCNTPSNGNLCPNVQVIICGLSHLNGDHFKNYLFSLVNAGWLGAIMYDEAHGLLDDSQYHPEYITTLRFVLGLRGAIAFMLSGMMPLESMPFLFKEQMGLGLSSVKIEGGVEINEARGRIAIHLTHQFEKELKEDECGLVIFVSKEWSATISENNGYPCIHGDVTASDWPKILEGYHLGKHKVKLDALANDKESHSGSLALKRMLCNKRCLHHDPSTFSDEQWSTAMTFPSTVNYPGPTTKGSTPATTSRRTGIVADMLVTIGHQQCLTCWTLHKFDPADCHETVHCPTQAWE
ncbi:hypothetical protein BS47DRAFT_1366788 [Hydnum rufescens UP504]|uniref:Helicase ATP-binding domain-containing protein n=1 Tax=Hydnum rufescens UP504 TaxID=1448309 RepID=A0A9P6DQC5_9AGAM|nr:hypothetical protein BS47DRAFT_1366788 [Hydnum rufescens UP504]